MIATGEQLSATAPEPTPEERWHHERHGVIGASEVSAILGVHPFKTALEVWARKTGRIDDVAAAREEALWGQLLEDPIAREWSRRTGREIIDHGRYALCLDAEAPHLGATLDREIVGPPPEALEIKTKDRYHPEWSHGQAPLYEVVQVQSQLAVKGWDRGVLAALVGRQLRTVTVERDDRLIASIREEVEEFWARYVATDTEPPIDVTHARAFEAVKMLHPRDSGATIDLAPDLLAVVDRWEEVAGALREAKRDKDALQAQLCQAIGDATFARLPAGRLKWATETRTHRCESCGHEKVVESRVLRRLKK